MLARYASSLVFLLAQVSLPSDIHADWSFQGLGAMNGAESIANDISADGRVVVGSTGYIENGSEDGTLWHDAFRWEGGEMDLLEGIPRDSHGSATHVSADGSRIVIGLSVGILSAHSYFSWKDGAIEPIDIDTVNDITADGLVAVGELSSRATRWFVGDGRYEYVGALTVPPGGTSSFATAISDDGSVVIGRGETADGAFDVFRREGDEIVALGIPGASPQACSSDGSVLVGLIDSEAFRYEDNETVHLGVLDGIFSLARDVSADGSVIVGEYGGYWVSETDYEYRAFVWEEAFGMRSLQGVLEGAGLDLMGWRLQRATGISDDGRTIVGYGINPDGYQEAFIATIPEPGTFTLLATLALPGLWLMWRRRR